MKRKVLATMMSLTLALAVTACGGSDTETNAAEETAVEETADETEAVEEDTTDETDVADTTEETAEEGPLYSIEASVAPEVAGTTWHFVNAMIDGEEFEKEEAEDVLENTYSGKLDVVFGDDDTVTMEQGGGSMEGTYEYVDDYTVLLTLDNNGSALQYACAFVEDEDGVTMVAMPDDTGNNGVYFMQ